MYMHIYFIILGKNKPMEVKAIMNKQNPNRIYRVQNGVIFDTKKAKYSQK